MTCKVFLQSRERPVLLDPHFAGYNNTHVVNLHGNRPETICVYTWTGVSWILHVSNANMLLSNEMELALFLPLNKYSQWAAFSYDGKNKVKVAKVSTMGMKFHIKLFGCH